MKEKKKKKSGKKAEKKAKKKKKKLNLAPVEQTTWTQPSQPIALEAPATPESKAAPSTLFSPLQHAFVEAWKSAGTTWGLPPAMGAVHGVLLSRDRAWSTDEVMEALGVSRGNAHNQLKALVEWGVVHEVKQLGSRRIRYLAERDVWRISTAVARERRQRELQPILDMQQLLRQHGAASRSMDDRALKTTMREIIAYGKLMDKLLGETLRRDERWWERLVRRWISRS